MDKETKEIQIKFEGVDFWSRPVYKDINTTIRYGSTDTLFPNERIAPNKSVKEINNYFKNNIEELVVFGSTFDEDDPLGYFPPKHYKLIIQD